MVNLTRIYTRTGDDGSTALADFSRTSKTDSRLGAYADVDEANAALGVVLALSEVDADVAELLREIQNDLFDVGADLATPVVADPEHPPLRVTEAYIAGWRQPATSTTRNLRRYAPSSCRAALLPPPCCTWPAPRCGARSGQPGRPCTSTDPA